MPHKDRIKSMMASLKKDIVASDQNKLAYEWLEKMEHDIKHDRWPLETLDQYLAGIVNAVNDERSKYKKISDFYGILKKQYKNKKSDWDAFFLQGKHSPTSGGNFYHTMNYETFFKYYLDLGFDTGDYNDERNFTLDGVWQQFEKEPRRLKPNSRLQCHFDAFFWATPYNIQEEIDRRSIKDICGKLGIRCKKGTRFVGIKLSLNIAEDGKIKAPTTIEGVFNEDFLPPVLSDIRDGFGRTYDIIKQTDGEREVVVKSMDVGNKPDGVVVFKLGEVSDGFEKRDHDQFMNRIRA